MHRVAARALVGLVMLFSSLAIQGQEATRTKEASTAESIDNPVIIKVFQIVHADATELHQVVQSLFNKNNSGIPSDDVLITMPSDDVLITMQTSVDARTNTIIAKGHEGDLQLIEDLLSRLDVKKSPEQGTTVYRMQNAPAQDVAIAINQWLTHRAGLGHSEGASRDAAVEAAKKKVAITPELVSNSLIVTTSFDEEQARELDSVIRALDKRPDMVKIQVILKQTVDGKETLLARPQIMTLDQMAGNITVGSESDFITLELTPCIIRSDDNPMKVTKIPRQTEDR